MRQGRGAGVMGLMAHAPNMNQLALAQQQPHQLLVELGGDHRGHVGVVAYGLYSTIPPPRSPLRCRRAGAGHRARSAERFVFSRSITPLLSAVRGCQFDVLGRRRYGSGSARTAVASSKPADRMARIAPCYYRATNTVRPCDSYVYTTCLSNSASSAPSGGWNLDKHACNSSFVIGTVPCAPTALRASSRRHNSSKGTSK